MTLPNTGFFKIPRVDYGGDTDEFVVQWVTFTGATTMDRITLEVRSANNDDDGFFKTSGPSESTALPGSGISVSIPANTLPPGVDLSVRHIFEQGSSCGQPAVFPAFQAPAP